MAALISSVMNTKDRVPFYVNACDELGIEVLPPDVNSSQTDFAVVEGKIRFGLNAVKSVGESAAQRDHPRARGGRAVRVDLGLHRARRPAGGEQARRSRRSSSAARSTRPAPRGWGCSTCSSRRSRRGRSTRPTGSRARRRSSTWATSAQREHGPKHHPAIPPSEFEKPELLKLEKETLGLYVSEHPLHGRARAAAPQDRLRRSPSSSAAATARSSRSAGSSPRSSS